MRFFRVWNGLVRAAHEAAAIDEEQDDDDDRHDRRDKTEHHRPQASVVCTLLLLLLLLLREFGKGRTRHPKNVAAHAHLVATSTASLAAGIEAPVLSSARRVDRTEVARHGWIHGRLIVQNPSQVRGFRPAVFNNPMMTTIMSTVPDSGAAADESKASKSTTSSSAAAAAAPIEPRLDRLPTAESIRQAQAMAREEQEQREEQKRKDKMAQVKIQAQVMLPLVLAQVRDAALKFPLVHSHVVTGCGTDNDLIRELMQVLETPPLKYRATSYDCLAPRFIHGMMTHEEWQSRLPPHGGCSMSCSHCYSHYDPWFGCAGGCPSPMALFCHKPGCPNLTGAIHIFW